MSENTPATSRPSGKRSRGWCFTVSNYTEDDLVTVKALAHASAYVIAGYEVAPKTGTPHIQGYVYYESARSFESMRKRLPRAHLEPARGTGEQNKKYCSKGGLICIEQGVPPQQGARSDIESIYDMLRDGASMRAVIETDPNLQCMQIAEKYLKYNEAPRTAAAEVRWYWGPPGAGKSYAARQWLGDDCHTASRTTSKFWDGYDAHKGVLIDDFRPKWCDFVELLGILDEGPYAVEVKGSSRQLVATKIAITCPFTPEELYSAYAENLEQLTGRITAIVHVDGTVRSRPPPRLCTLGPDGHLVDNICAKGKHATGDAEGSRQGPVQEETPATTNQNIEWDNNIGVRVTPANAIYRNDRTRPQVSEPRQRRRQIRGQTYFDESDGSYTTQETICFAQGQSLCSSGSAPDDSDGASLSDYDTGTQDDISREDDDAYSCEP